MVCRQRELHLDVAVALIAQLRLRLDKLTGVQPAVLLRQLGHIEEVGLRRSYAFAFGLLPASVRCMEWQLLQSTPCWRCSECVKSF